MARQRYSFFTAMEWVLDMMHQWFARFWGKRLSALLLVCLFVLSVGIAPVRSQMLLEQQHSQTLDMANQKIQLGKNAYKKDQFADALKSWKDAEKTYQQINNQDGISGSRFYQFQALKALGIYPQACSTLLSAIPSFNSPVTCNDLDAINKTINRTYWDELTAKIENFDSPHQVSVWHGLGESLRLIGELEKSKRALEKIALSDRNPEVLLSLGNTERALGNLERDRRSSTNYDYQPWRYIQHETFTESNKSYAQSGKYYRQILIDGNSSEIIKFKAKLNCFTLLVETESPLNLNSTNDGKCAVDIRQLGLELMTLVQSSKELFPNSLAEAYTRISLAKNLAYLKQASDNIWQEGPSWKEIHNLLKDKVPSELDELKSDRALSYLFGNLAGLYEYCSRYQCQLALEKDFKILAEEYTQKALSIAQPSEMPDIAYLWQWQLGRLAGVTGKREEAIANYEASITTLKKTRIDLISINSDVQFSFRDDIEPVYRELVDLLLDSEDPSQESRLKAIEYIDSLQVAELENFLNCDLSSSINIVDSQSKKSKNNDPSLFPIILKDRLVTLSTYEKDKIDIYIKKVSYQTVEKKISEMRTLLKSPSKTQSAKQIAGEFYDWMIVPFEKRLDTDQSFERSKIKTISFVLDGSLKNIPMSVLYDQKRNRYLLERYAVAVAPSLKLLELEKLPRNFSTLAAGLSHEGKHPYNGEDLPAIQGVEDELKKILSVTGGKKLLNETFTLDNLRDNIDTGKFSVVHLATHGEFSSDPNKSFILLSRSPEETRISEQSVTTRPESTPLQAKGLDNTLRRKSKVNTKIKLLVLSACETAAGDKRAALGLSGLAIRAGARSTLASLWQADDEVTPELMSSFYRNLKQGEQVSRAIALRSAQMSLWKLNEDWKKPRYWATYIVIGNWL
jgi:CHAT domain-containing protein/tetratricopeptide (TPR) repeat protein